MKEQDKQIQHLLNNLDERTKELNSLYQVDEILNDIEQNHEEAFTKLLHIIPGAFRFSDICRVEIITGNFHVSAPDLVKTDLKLSYPIVAEGEQFGHINIYYIKTVRMEKGIFIEHERRFIKTIADKISKFILLKKLKDSIEDQADTSKTGENSTDLILSRTKEWLKGLHLTDEEINRMTRVKLDFRKGEIINKQGALASYIMILANGISKNYLEGNQERGFNFKIVKPFDFIGLSALYGSQIYHFSGAAITPCTMYLIESTSFKEIIFSNVDFATEVFKWYCNITEGHLNRLSCIANKQALGRICEILTYLIEDVFENNIIDAIITRKHIAELAGMSTESAVRILSELRKDKIIQMTNKGIEVLNTHKLKTLSQTG